jgi:hypothetical protein
MELNYLFGLYEVNDRDTVFPGLPKHNPGLTKVDWRVSEVMAMWLQCVKSSDFNAEGYKITVTEVKY